MRIVRRAKPDARACVLILTLLTGCYDDLRKAEHSVFSTRPLPANAAANVVAGGPLEIAVQFLDKDNEGVDGADCVFIVSDPDVLSFGQAIGGPNWLRTTSGADDVLGVRGSGLAVVHLTVGPVQEPVDVTVWAGPTDRDNVATAAEATATQPWSFRIHVEPASGNNAQDGGAPDATAIVDAASTLDGA